mmetsp:Transcript_24417/g.51820  ORF Transcript_24417/g.51820 Transcript_24417/m.51820 type:complete len:96 (-) Transcript_24417:362-649(-)
MATLELLYSFLQLLKSRPVLAEQLCFPSFATSTQLPPPFLGRGRVGAFKKAGKRIPIIIIGKLLGRDEVEALIELSGQYLAEDPEEQSRHNSDID